jgi:hypothetical protein
MKSSEHMGNLSVNERAWSAAIGTVMSLLVLRRGSAILRSLVALAGLGLIARSAAGHCAIKAALTGNSSIADGFRDQWRHISAGSTPGRHESLETEEFVEQRATPESVQEGVR